MDLFGHSEAEALRIAAQAEAEIARQRHRQAQALSRLWLDRVAGIGAARSANEFVASRLDVSPETASRLVQAARAFHHHPKVRDALEVGEVTFDRACELFRQSGDAADPVESRRYDIAGLRRLAAKQRRLSRHHERDIYTHRYVAIQPNLDESQWDLRGRLAGIDGRLVEQALHTRGDRLGDLPDTRRLSRGQRNADALVAIAQDSFGFDRDEASSSGPRVTVFIDLDEAANTNGTLGAEIEFGPRVGPNALAELLCGGSIQVVGIHEGRPVVASDATRAIPPAIRRFVAWRDGGCTADGCQSHYRLEPHHIIERSRGGSDDPSNLTTLCWFHHHVVVHGSGYGIDSESPPGRIRFTRPHRNRAPP